MIVFDTTPQLRKERCLIADISAASAQAKNAVRTLLSARIRNFNTVVFRAEELEHLGDMLRTLNAPEYTDSEITPDAEHFLSEIAEEQRYITELKKEPVSIEWLKENIQGWKTIPYPDQLSCIRFHTQNEKSIEGGETGIGKSLIILYTFLYWKTRHPDLRGIIFCLNSGKLDWLNEVQQHTNLKALAVSNGSKNVLQDLEKFRENYDLLIVHYQAFTTNTVVHETLAQIPIGFVALDEIHTLKNPTTLRYKCIHELLTAWNNPKLICATGTIMDGSPKSAWVPLKFTNKKPAYFPSYTQFCNHFIVYGTQSFYRNRVKRTVKVEMGYKNLRDLKSWLAPKCIRFMKCEVSDRPSKIFKTRIVQLTGQQLKIYKQVRDTARVQLQSVGDKITTSNLINITLRLRQVVHHPNLLNMMHVNCDSAKYLELDDLLEEILSNPDAQVLVWTQWRHGVDNIVKRYPQYNAIPFWGGSDIAEVRDAVLSKHARLIVAIPEKAGTSVDFLKVCRTAIYLEKPWSLSLYRQSLDRIDRRTNTDAAVIISIEAENTIDQCVNAVLKRRQDIFDATTLHDNQLIAMGKDELLRYLQ